MHLGIQSEFESKTLQNVLIDQYIFEKKLLI